MARGLGLGALSAVFGPGAGFGAANSPAAQLADLERDVRVLEGLMAGERLLAYGYTQVLEAQVLKRAAANVVLVAYGYEQSHAAAVQSAITALEGQIAGLATSLPAVRHAAPPSQHPSHPQPFPPPKVAERFAHIHQEAYAIVQLSHVEIFVQSFYFNAIVALSVPELVRTTTQILACKAQQWSLYQDLLSHGKVMHTVPKSFVRGSATLPR